MRRAVFPLFTLLAVSGCILDPGRCTYEVRTMDFQATVKGIVMSQPDTGTVELSLSETKGSLDNRTLTVSVSTFLAGAVSSVEIWSTTSATPLAVFSPGSTTTPGLWYANLTPTSDSPSFVQLEFLARSGHLQVIVNVGPGSSDRMIGDLRFLGDTGWDRPNCS